MVRYTDPSNYYYVTLRTSNELSLRKVVNGVFTELARAPLTLQSNSVLPLAHRSDRHEAHCVLE